MKSLILVVLLALSGCSMNSTTIDSGDLKVEVNQSGVYIVTVRSPRCLIKGQNTDERTVRITPGGAIESETLGILGSTIDLWSALLGFLLNE